jgi:YHS domain-containing protein
MKPGHLLFLPLLFGIVILTGAVNSGQVAAAERVNQLCPVSGDKLGAAGKFSYDYQGKTYGFCCLKCVKVFKKNPEKYSGVTR